MGGQNSTPEQDNKGLLNGNIINNGILKSMDSELSHIEKLFYIIVATIIITFIILTFKSYGKYIKKKNEIMHKIDGIPAVIPRNA